MGILGESWQNHCKTTVSLMYGRLFLVSNRSVTFSGEVGALDVSHWEGQASGAWYTVVYSWSAFG